MYQFELLGFRPSPAQSDPRRPPQILSHMKYFRRITRIALPGGRGGDRSEWDDDVSKGFIFRLTTEGAPCSRRIQASESLC